MADEQLYRYWVADCKTPDCGTLLLALIGRYDPFRIPLLPYCADFSLTCGHCMKEYLYTQRDVRVQATDKQIPQFRDAPEFVRATIPPPIT